MSENQIKIPIDVTRPEQFLGHEFFLWIQREHLNEELIEKYYASKRVKRVIKAIRDFVNGWHGQKSKEIYGVMAEIIQRQPGRLDGYYWPSFNRATLEDGTSIDKIPDPKSVRSYIFVPQDAQLTNGSGYQMSGTMRRYNFDDSVGELEQKIIIQYDNIPEYKETGVHLAFV